MNKEQIEEARKYFIEKGHAEQIFGIRIFYDKDVISLMAGYLESKREEIERQAYEIGVVHGCTYTNKTQMVSEWSKHDFPTYDKLKENQNKEA